MRRKNARDGPEMRGHPQTESDRHRQGAERASLAEQVQLEARRNRHKYSLMLEVGISERQIREMQAYPPSTH
jgi:hypothetical protein